jgi:hypothetical protein
VCVFFETIVGALACSLTQTMARWVPAEARHSDAIAAILTDSFMTNPGWMAAAPDDATRRALLEFIFPRRLVLLQGSSTAIVQPASDGDGGGGDADVIGHGALLPPGGAQASDVLCIRRVFLKHTCTLLPVNAASRRS